MFLDAIYIVWPVSLYKRGNACKYLIVGLLSEMEVFSALLLNIRIVCLQMHGHPMFKQVTGYTKPVVNKGQEVW